MVKQSNDQQACIISRKFSRCSFLAPCRHGGQLPRVIGCWLCPSSSDFVVLGGEHGMNQASSSLSCLAPISHSDALHSNNTMESFQSGAPTASQRATSPRRCTTERLSKIRKKDARFKIYKNVHIFVWSRGRTHASVIWLFVLHFWLLKIPFPSLSHVNSIYCQGIQGP